MDAIVEMLDRLTEYQAQADLLELEKRRLLDEVKIPAEVLALQDQANKARQALDSELWNRQKEMGATRDDLISKIIDPEMPPEFVAALEKARRERAEVMSNYDAMNVSARQKALEAKAKIDADLQAQTREVYNQVAIRKTEIAAEFDGKAESVLDNIAKLTADIKRAVVKHGETVKGTVFTMVFKKGRTTWTTDTLDSIFFDLNTVKRILETMETTTPIAMLRAAVNDIINGMEKARKVGEPSTALTKNK